MVQGWRKGTTRRGSLTMIDIFNFWFDDEFVSDIAIVDYVTWITRALEHMTDEDKSPDGIENIWKE